MNSGCGFWLQSTRRRWPGLGRNGFTFLRHQVGSGNHHGTVPKAVCTVAEGKDGISRNVHSEGPGGR